MPPKVDKDTLQFLNLGYVACYVAEDGVEERYPYVMFWLVYPKNFRIPD